MSYIFEDFPEEFLRFEDIVGEDIPCHDDYLDERFAPIPQKDNWYDSVRNGTAHPPTDEDREIGFQKMRIPVLAVNLETGEETEFRSQTDAGRELGIQQANIWKVLNGERRSAGGYYFEYLRRGEEE